MLDRPVVLIGPMGVGKTTVGKKLAKRLDVSFIDTDALVVKEHGPIDEIFKDSGEEAFRGYEAVALEQALSQIQVVATGGGAVLRGENQRALERGIVIYLSTNGQHMSSRLSKGNRPLLKNGLSDWREIYETRKPLYERLSSFEVDVSSGPLSTIIDEICKKLENA
jgi:shikimate kinase